MILRPLVGMAALSASVAAWPASAASFVDLAAIDREVETFTGSPIGEPGGAAMPVDRRLRLNLCGAAFALRWAGPRRDSVVVSCPEPGGWRVFVPIAGGGQGEAGAPAVIRGDAVTIAVTGANFAVMQPGEALEAGAVGAWIQVRPAQSQAQTKPAALRARVVRPGLVSLTLP